MKLWVILIVLVISFSSWAKESSKLVDVDKNSKLSDYFSKINKKVSDNPEDIPLNEEKASVDVEKELLASIEESEIPLNLKKESKIKKSSLSPLNKMMISIVGLLFIAGAVFVWVQKSGKKAGFSSVAKNINILAKKPIGPKKDLMLLQLAGETLLLGVTDQNINHLKTLSLLEDELPAFTNPKFSQEFAQKIEETKISDETEEVDGFAVSQLDQVKEAINKRFSI
ncbi:MAG: flagellar biosynthetic protein FliO [Bdellovibrionales bacterium]|nr:flagellar biosynthetic protein FliO [Bdellovibrionales bacterium]NQZ19798.1 flagellar biosynthetic protein FliO [Bdellovibrionales bacterium]